MNQNTSTSEDDDLQGETQEFWTVMRQGSSAAHISWSLEQVVFHTKEPAFERLRTNRAEYNHTLVRLIGIVWVTGMSADNIVGEEQRRLERQGYSEEFQAYCDEVAAGLLGANR